MIKPIPFVFFIILLIVSSQRLFSQAISFKEIVVDNNFNGPAGICVKDVDNNGFKDIIAAGYNAADICIWFHNGENPVTWHRETVDANFAGAIYAAAEDLNGDGLVDIIGAGWDANKIVWWKNSGGSNPIQWVKTVIDSNSDGAHEVFVFDLENDGDMDIASASAMNNRIALHINNGGDPVVWTTEVISNDVSGARSVCAGDIDNDNDVDIIGAAYSSNEIALWRNEGGQPVTWTKFSIVNNFTGAHRVCLYDLEGDGDLDILAAAYILDQIAWFRNDGGNPVQWTKIAVANNFNGALISCPADIDLDGDIDIVATATNNSQLAWWENDGSDPINWTKTTIKSLFYAAWPLFIEDIDNDFDQDIIAGANQSDDIIWWENLLYKADFSGEPAAGVFPLEVHFTDHSTLDSEVISWEWDFDFDGTIDSYIQNPVWTYNQEGTYTVYLKVSDGRSVDTEIKTDYINTTIVSVSENNPVPEKFNLFQNYPNPFNPVTFIKYQLPSLTFVSLKVFNILGKEVSEIVHEYQSAGEKIVEWNGKDQSGQVLNSGVYFCELKAGETILTRKMLLMK